jgi:hypothetical protein
MEVDPDAPQAAPPTPQVALPQLSPQQQELEKAREEAEELRRKLQKLEEAVNAEAKEKKEKDSAAKAAAKQEEATLKAFAQLNHQAQFKEEDLPDLAGMEVQTEDAKETVCTMYHWARASHLGDQYLPFTFAQMGATVEMAYSLVEKDIWEAFFGESGYVSEEDVCPMILRQIMFRQLMHFAEANKTKVDEKEEHAVNAKKLLGEASTELLAKKRKLRNAPYG